ncbi:unnamed protein product [Caenorhabditis bovis]|uniref:PCI domain-containing protein n=1 Tax=Caenorhabditis bovis TaxID=2654633 RepID=A0A8S1EBH2_9PELO|nr:unnamed protein product [Caenorhabditis bovis]
MSAEPIDDPMDTSPANSALDGNAHELLQIQEIVMEESLNPVSTDIIKPSTAKQNEPARDEDNEETILVYTPAIDVETIPALYSQLGILQRLEFIIKVCPPLKQDAIITLINYIRENTQNSVRYTSLHKELEDHIKINGFSSNLSKPKYDSNWVMDTNAIVNSRRDSALSDYKKFKDEGVKESTRRAIEELFQHYMRTGEIDEALKLYGRGVRDYCTQLKHVINMYSNWIEISIADGDWARVDSMTFQALRSLNDAEEAEKTNNGRQDQSAFMMDRDNMTHSSSVQSNRVLIDSAMARVYAAQALVRLRQQKYKSAAERILELKVDHLPDRWFVSNADLGIYCVLCCIATFKRSELKKKMSEDGVYRKLLESEPQFLELLRCYTSSQFGKCFEIMNSVSDRLHLDPYISQNVNDLYTLVRKRCVVQYLIPYSNISFNTIMKDLQFTQEEVERIVVELIESGEIEYRIDQAKGLLRAINKNDKNATSATYA